ncbi:Hypothetical protein, putative [Bodo saltans]|uniref:Uncharacterized protein n=1 Tax=Bodo saltans TaxID=75058 RepID=A0A0S4IP45_BODSA|nr:Hypothetical protein, putative [Bodo saltans]|eukprot:CUE99699.1 Hypothetical protein, putative [Bodo saltans]
MDRWERLHFPQRTIVLVHAASHRFSANWLASVDVLSKKRCTNENILGARQRGTGRFFPPVKSGDSPFSENETSHKSSCV